MRADPCHGWQRRQLRPSQHIPWATGQSWACDCTRGVDRAAHAVGGLRNLRVPVVGRAAEVLRLAIVSVVYMKPASLAWGPDPAYIRLSAAGRPRDSVHRSQVSPRMSPVDPPSYATGYEIVSVNDTDAGTIDITGRVGAHRDPSRAHPELSGNEDVYLFGRSSACDCARSLPRRRDRRVRGARGRDRPSGEVLLTACRCGGFSVPCPSSILPCRWWTECLPSGSRRSDSACLERMRDLLGAGTTLVFVSHDLAAVEATCSRRSGSTTVCAVGRPDHDVLHGYRESLEQGSVVSDATATRRAQPRLHHRSQTVAGPE